MYLLPFPILGAVLAWVTVYIVGFRKQGWAEFLLGTAAFFIAMFVQSPVQQLPLLGAGIRSNADVVTRGTAFTIMVALWLGLVAGFVQEGVKYYLVKDRKLREAVFVGLGFGVTEAVVLALATVLPAAMKGGTVDVPLTNALLSMVERYFATLFHVGTAVFLAYAFRQGFGMRGLLLAVGVHTVLDSITAYLQLVHFIRPRPYHALNLLGYFLEALLAIIGVAFFAYGALKALEEPEVEEELLW